MRCDSGRSALVLFVLSCGMFAGCSSTPPPDHAARFWLWPGESMALRVEGERPMVQIENPGPGPLSAVEWRKADGTTTFNGIPVGGDMVLTLSPGDQLRLLDGGGSHVSLRMWNSTGYSLDNAPPVGTLRGLTNDEMREKLALIPH